MKDLNIKQIRTNLGLTQADLAKKLGVDTKTVQNWEYGTTTIPKSKYGILGVLASNKKDLPNDLAFTIKELRKRLDITQVELANKIGVTENTIQNWERGKKIPTTKHQTLIDLWESVPSLSPQQYFGGGTSSTPGEAQESPGVVPLMPFAAQGGRLTDFSESVSEWQCEKVISPIKGVDFAISVSGDSMSPEYPSGSIVLIKRINEVAFIEWGKVYVLDTCNGVVIKKLMPTDEEGKMQCVSINPEYPPFEVHLEHVYGVYKVLMVMAIK